MDDIRSIFSDKMKFTPEELDELRSTIQDEVVDVAIDKNLEEISRLRKTLAEEAEASKKRMRDASSLDAQYVKQNFREQISKVKDEFLESTRDFRETTKRIAAADQMAATSGRGVDWGSWGTVGGMDVVVGDSSDMPKLLGSVDSARRRGEMLADSETTVTTSSENRIMVVSDEQKVNTLCFSVVFVGEFNNLSCIFRTRDQNESWTN